MAFFLEHCQGQVPLSDTVTGVAPSQYMKVATSSQFGLTTFAKSTRLKLLAMRHEPDSILPCNAGYLNIPCIEGKRGRRHCRN